MFKSDIMIQRHTAAGKFAITFLMFILTAMLSNGQNAKQALPVWWFGASGAANFNYYRGTTQMLNNSITVPTAFHKGNGVRPYVSLLTEYRPNRVWGGMLNIAYDNRGSKFDGVEAPCNCPASLTTNISYIAIEPSLRLAPFASSFYIFAGPTLNFNVSKSFTYTQLKQVETTGDWSDIHKTGISAQAGVGFDFMLSARTSASQMSLSPFASFQTDFGHEPRSVESWSFYTLRAGLALKFGKSKKTPTILKPAEAPLATVPEPAPVTAIVIEKEVQFSVRAPITVPVDRRVKETFALRNSVFFNMGSSEIPQRYILLDKTAATSFREEHLQESQPENLNAGRSFRQLIIYHNILNIIGDRMRASPQSSIVLTGASDKNPREGKLMAENVKKYLVTVFDIGASRIKTEGRDKPLIPSEQPGATRELALLKEGDRRVDMTSTSPALLMQVGGSSSEFMKPVQITSVLEDPLDSHVIFTTEGAEELLNSWSVEITDEKGNSQSYGSYTKDQASVSGKTILRNDKEGNYKVVMLGQSKSGHLVKKEGYVHLVKEEDAKKMQLGLRYSILFDFDKSKTISAYERFLVDVVTPLIPENGTVIIHGHTDIIGEEKYNQNLSQERAVGAQKIIEQALTKSGKKGIKFETYGFGKDTNMSPFENNLPEERFYNRTVIIDIVPAK